MSSPSLNNREFIGDIIERYTYICEPLLPKDHYVNVSGFVIAVDQRSFNILKDKRRTLKKKLDHIKNMKHYPQ